MTSQKCFAHRGSDWERIVDRKVPEREGRPIVGVDLGGGRAWSAAVAVWGNGRVEARAVAPGIPDLDEQERRDRQPQGTYTKLYDMGQLEVAEGLRVQPPAALWEMIRTAWGKPQLVVLDRFRLAEFEDAVKRGARLEPRVSRWSEAAFDIRSLRAMALDGPMAVDEDSQALLETSLAQAMVKSDDAGNTRLVKKGSNNQSRDDVAAALGAGRWCAGPKARKYRCAQFGVSRVSWRRGPKVNRKQWRKVRLVILDRDGWRCQKCGKAGRMEVDHIKPLDEAGRCHTTQVTCKRFVLPVIGRSHAVNDAGGRQTPKWQSGGRYLTDSPRVVYAVRFAYLHDGSVL